MATIRRKTDELITMIHSFMGGHSESHSPTRIAINVKDLSEDLPGISCSVTTGRTNSGLVWMTNHRPLMYKRAVSKAEEVARAAYTHYASMGVSCVLEHHPEYGK